MRSQVCLRGLQDGFQLVLFYQEKVRLSIIFVYLSENKRSIEKDNQKTFEKHDNL